jgi:hypothetical protein
MNLRSILLGTAAAAGLLLVPAVSGPASLSPVSQAEAAVSASISINVFYDRLAAHGDWVTYHDRYVWVPRVDASWRPYVHGHWIYVRTYGWYWVSDEPYAWAVYHYGRWAFDPEIGWYWVPARRWAPAWVAWSYTDDEIAWAPLPPDYDDDDISVAISVSSIPVHYWNVVPVNVFISVDIDRYIIRDRDNIRRVIEAGDTKTVVVQNNVVVNNFIDVDVIKQKTKQDVVVYEPKPADSPEAADKPEGQVIAVFDAPVQEEPAAKPPKVKKAEEVAKEKKASGMVPEEPAAGTAAQEPAATPEGQAAEGEQPVKKKKTQAAEEQPAAAPEGQAAEGEQPVKKKKTQAAEEQPKASEEALEAAPEAAPETKAVQPQKKQKEKACDPAKEQCPQE